MTATNDSTIRKTLVWRGEVAGRRRGESSTRTWARASPVTSGPRRRSPCGAPPTRSAAARRRGPRPGGATPEGRRAAWLAAHPKATRLPDAGPEASAATRGATWADRVVAGPATTPSASWSEGTTAAGAPVGRYHAMDREAIYVVLGEDEAADLEAREQARIRGRVYAAAADLGLARVQDRDLNGWDWGGILADPRTEEERDLLAQARVTDEVVAQSVAALERMDSSGAVTAADAAALPDGYTSRDWFRGTWGREGWPSRQHLGTAIRRAIRRAREGGRDVCWHVAHVVASASLPAYKRARPSSLTAELARRGLTEQVDRALSPGDLPLDDLSAWCVELGCVDEAAELRAAERRKLVEVARRKLCGLSPAQRKLVDAAGPARRTGLELAGRQKRSAAKLVELGLAEQDDGGRHGRLWLSPLAAEAAGLPRLQADEAMRRAEREAAGE